MFTALIMTLGCEDPGQYGYAGYDMVDHFPLDLVVFALVWVGGVLTVVRDPVCCLEPLLRLHYPRRCLRSRLQA